jgi:outer membrane protein assembly factor BamB
VAGILAAVALLAVGVVAAPARAVDLPTYGYGNARLGSTDSPVGLSTGSDTRLHTAWIARLRGAIDGQPLVLNGIRVRGRKRDVVLAASEHGEIVAVDVGNGGVLWQRRVGFRLLSKACLASPDGVFGVTSTMVADRASGRLYAVDVNGRAWALSLATGRVVPGWPVRAHPGPPDFDWGALTLANGKLYVPTASECGNGTYFGSIRAIDVKTRRVKRWLSEVGTHAYGGGVWGWGGLSVDARSGDVFASSGNAIPLSREHAGFAERVIRFTPDLKIEQSNYPLQPPFPTSDRDFGTAPVLVNAAGCPQEAVAIDKDGNLYLYDTDRISAGPIQHILVASIKPGSIPLYGMPAYDAKTRRLVLTSPARGHNLIAGIQTFVLGPRCHFVQSWQRRFDPPDAGSPPTIAGGAIYISSGRSGIIRVFRLTDGHELWGHSRGSTIFDAPAVADKTVFFGDWAGRLWALRPR